MTDQHANEFTSAEVRPCTTSDRGAMIRLINAAATAYRGVIPADCWHEPYMSPAELDREIEAGVAFQGLATGGELIGIMGVQRTRNVDLVRHAYVDPRCQGQGIGSILLEAVCRLPQGPILIGTWRAATWAVRFYIRHGFTIVPDAASEKLLRTYWQISERQIETSLVLSKPALDIRAVDLLISHS